MAFVRRFAPLMALVLMVLLVSCGGGTNNGGGRNNDGNPGPTPPVPPTPTPPPGFVTRIDIFPAASVLGLGGTQQLQVVATYGDGTHHNVNRFVTFAVSPAAVASVSGNALLSANSPGTATITATLQGISGSAQVTVVDGQLTALAVTPQTASVQAGSTVPFTATATFSNGQQVSVTNQAIWTSSNPVVATVSNGTQSNGVAEGRSPGVVTISARFGAFTASGTLTVTSAVVVSIAVTPAAATIQIGHTQAFTATATFSDGVSRDVTSQAAWSSSNAAVATVNPAGVATGVTAGSVQISATLQGVSGAATLTVRAANLVSIAVTPANLTLAFGSDEQYTATGTYDDGDTEDLTNLVTWSSSNAPVATVSATGLVRAVSQGTAVITATLGAISGNTNVTVSPAALVSIAITPVANTSIVTGTTRPYTAIGTFSDGHTQDITTTVNWTTSNPAIATVSNAVGTEGRVTGVSNGIVNVTATEGAISATVSARVMLYMYGTDGIFVYSYSVNPTSGAINPIGTPINFGSCICQVQVDPFNRFVFALDGDLDEVFTLLIDPATGTLTLQPGSTSVGNFSNAIGVSPDGRFLYSVDGNDSVVYGFSIDQTTGALASVGPPAAAGQNPNFLAFDPTSRFLYVSDSADNTVFGYAINASSGVLTPLGGSPYPAGDLPFGVAVSVDGRFVYVVNDASENISGYAVAADGSLSPLAGFPFPAPGGQPFGITADPLGGFFYATDFSDSTIHAWAADANTGQFSNVPGQPFNSGGELPGTVAIDPAGRYLYVPFIIDPVVSGFGISPANGALAPLVGSPFPVDNPFEFITTTH